MKACRSDWGAGASCVLVSASRRNSVFLKDAMEDRLELTEKVRDRGMQLPARETRALLRES